MSILAYEAANRINEASRSDAEDIAMYYKISTGTVIATMISETDQRHRTLSGLTVTNHHLNQMKIDITLVTRNRKAHTIATIITPVSEVSSKSSSNPQS
jgi:hypothetical protein